MALDFIIGLIFFIIIQEDRLSEPQPQHRPFLKTSEGDRYDDMAASSNKGINKRIDKGHGFTEFGFEQNSPIFRMIGTEQKKSNHQIRLFGSPE
jgi:hypothetical protein